MYERDAYGLWLAALTRKVAVGLAAMLLVLGFGAHFATSSATVPTATVRAATVTMATHPVHPDLSRYACESDAGGPTTCNPVFVDGPGY